FTARFRLSVQPWSSRKCLRLTGPHGMSTLNAVYIRANGKATLEAVRGGFEPLVVEQHGEFIGIKTPPRRAPEEILSRLPVMFGTDVFWLGFESAMDCFEFHHWQSGRHMRSLVYGLEEERRWERVDGTPEPWERRFLFHPKNMECELSDAEDDDQRQTI